MRKRRLTVGFYTTVLALILLIAGAFIALRAYDVFSYKLDRWAVVLFVVGAWATVFLLLNTLLRGERPFGLTVLLTGTAIFSLVLALCLFIKPCLSPIGIYFTVHNMGDVETNAVGVPLSIVAAAVFLGAIVLLLLSSFGRLEKDKYREERL